MSKVRMFPKTKLKCKIPLEPIVVTREMRDLFNAAGIHLKELQDMAHYYVTQEAIALAVKHMQTGKYKQWSPSSDGGK